jgi:hypothetical protein
MRIYCKCGGYYVKQNKYRHNHTERHKRYIRFLKEMKMMTETQNNHILLMKEFSCKKFT